MLVSPAVGETSSNLSVSFPICYFFMVIRLVGEPEFFFDNFCTLVVALLISMLLLFVPTEPIFFRSSGVYFGFIPDVLNFGLGWPPTVLTQFLNAVGFVSFKNREDISLLTTFFANHPLAP